MEQHKNKYRWFKFFFLYKDAFKELSGRNSKKLILALIDYAEKGYTTIKLNQKTQSYFISIKSFHDADIDIYRQNGRKGGLKTQKNNRNARGKSEPISRAKGVVKHE